MSAHARLAAAAALLVSSMAAHAVVESGHWTVFPDNSPGSSSNTVIRVDQTVGGDFTGTFWNYNAAAGTIRFVTLNLDEGSELFLVKPGDIVDQAMVTSPGAHDLIRFTVGSGNATTVIGKDFYLGAATSSVGDPGMTSANYTNRTTFGWAHLQPQADGTLKILDSAMAFREGSIRVGTLQAVPEPSTWTLMGLGLVGVAAMSRQRKAAAA